MKPQIVQPVKLIIGFLYQQREIYLQALEQCHDIWGIADHQSREYFFDFTDYYDSEMGSPLFRALVSFGELIDPGEIADIKIATNQIEERLARNNLRKVNLDPGYLDFHKLVLASAKYNQQKIYLSRGIYADPTLYYQKGRFIPFDWAFPDFKSGIYEDDLLCIRHLYKQQLRQQS